jgi:ubiquinol-cytochrome c reductase iron-sulfur subunit
MNNDSDDKNQGPSNQGPTSQGTTRRDFITLTTASAAVVGASCALWPFIDSMNPASNVLAEASVEYDLSNVAPGQNVVIKWRGKPIFIKRRTANELADLRATKTETLIDPQRDEDRVKAGHDEWLVTIGICTHLGCVPLGNKGEYEGGWFCPCHGSEYDASGRVRRGPAPKNLEIPPYVFLSDSKIKIG